MTVEIGGILGGISCPACKKYHDISNNYAYSGVSLPLRQLFAQSVDFKRFSGCVFATTHKLVDNM